MAYGVTNPRQFGSQLVTSHRMRVRVELLNLAGSTVLADLSDRLLDGQVDIDADAETTRSADVTVSDPDRALALDSRTLGDGAVFVDRMIRVHYGVYVEELARWIDVPIFTGPITGMSRDGVQLQLACLGKEHLAKGSLWTAKTFRSGTDKVQAVRVLLQAAGETRFAFPAKGGRMAELSLGRTAQPWTSALSIAQSMGRQLYYDGGGTCRMRSRPDPGNTPVWTFASGTGGSVLSTPSVDYDVSSAKNRVWVKGKKPNKKKQVTFTATAPRNHPLSPWNLGRNGQPRFLVELVENNKIGTKAEARRVANNTLTGLLTEGVEVSFDALPIPHLDPLDPVRLSTPEASLAFVLRQASIPLTTDGAMSVGANKQVTLRQRKR